MLQARAVDARLLELLRFAMAQPEFADMRLVGGTALALRLGHRISVDIDLFGSIALDTVDVAEVLGRFGSTLLIQKSRNIAIYAVEGIKIDIVNYRYGWLRPPLHIDNMRIAAQEDIAAMKLNAISGRGSRKDFIDIYALLKTFSIKEMMEFYERKYHDGSVFQVRKSLTYFQDAEQEAMPQMLWPLEWDEIKAGILKSLD